MKITSWKMHRCCKNSLFDITCPFTVPFEHLHSVPLEPSLGQIHTVTPCVIYNLSYHGIEEMHKVAHIWDRHHVKVQIWIDISSRLQNASPRHVLTTKARSHGYHCAVKQPKMKTPLQPSLKYYASKYVTKNLTHPRMSQCSSSNASEQAYASSCYFRIQANVSQTKTCNNLAFEISSLSQKTFELCN